jgi:hypothetical protein
MFGNGEMVKSIEYNLKNNISDAGLSSVITYLNKPITELKRHRSRSRDNETEVEGWQRERYDNLLKAVESGEVKLSEQDLSVLKEAYETNSMYQEKDIIQYASDQANDYGSKWLEQKFKDSPYYTGIRANLDDLTNKYTLEEKMEAVKDHQKFLKDDYNKFEETQSKTMENTFNAMKKANVGWEFFGEGEDMYVVVDSDDEGLREEYQTKVNSILETNKVKWGEYKKAFNKDHSEAVAFYNKNEEDSKIANTINKEFNTMAILGEDIGNGFQNLFVAIPAAFGHQSSMQRLKDIERGGEALETMLTYEEAIELGAKGQFTLRTGAQQSANIITAVASTAIGIPPVALAGVFGLSSAGGKRMELSTLVDQKEIALSLLGDLENNKGFMSDYDYSRRKASLEKTVAAGTMTKAQLEGSVIATGIIEGGITAIGMGTIPNAKKVVAALSGSVKTGIGTLITRSNLRAAGSFLHETGKQIGGELLEEEAIFFSDQIVNGLIMQKDMDFSGWDDVAVSTIITTGGMNGSTSLYSTVTQQMATSEMRQEVKNILSEVSALETSLSKLKPGKADDKYRAQLHQQFRDKMGDLSIVQAGLEVDALVAGSDNIIDLIENSVNLSELHAKADIKPGDSDETIKNKIKGYTGSKDVDGEDFKSRLNAAHKAIDKVRNSTNAKLQGDPLSLIESTFGKRGLKQYERLSGKEGFADLSARDQLITVNDAIKKNFRNSVVREARNNPIVKNFVESEVYGGKTFEESGRKNRNKKKEDEWYEQVGFNYNSQKAKARTLYDGSRESLKALEASGDVKDLNLIEAKTLEEFKDFLDTRDDLSPKQKKEFLDDFKDENVKGFIIGSDYIVQNAKGVQENLNKGDILQGTVISHEIGHALDDVTMKKGEMANYSENLSKHVLSDKVLAPLHELAIERLSSIKMWDNSKDFDKQSPVAKEEYVRAIQDLITADMSKYMPAARKAGSSGMNIVRGIVPSFIADTKFRGKNIVSTDFKFNTPKDAMSYLADFIDSFSEGKLSSKIQRKKKAFEKAGEKTEVPKKRYSKEDRKSDVDELSRMGWTNKTWKDSGANFALAEMQSNKMLDGLIAAKMKGGLRDGDNETKKDFISKVYAELTTHVKNFNPESNDSLFGWVNSQIANKAGNVYNREYKDKTLERAIDVDATTSEGAPLVQIEADMSLEMAAIDRIGLTDIEVEERSRLRRDIRLDDKMIQTVKDAIIKTFGTKLPNVNSKDFRKALEKAFRTELKKPLQDLMGTRSEFDLFLRNHSKAIIKALPVETLVQMERNLKPGQRIFTESRRITKPTEVDKLISEGKLPKDTNRTSGPQLHTKTSFPGVDKVMAYFRGKDMENVLGYKVGASTLGTRKDKLSMELGVELAFDATSEVLQDPTVAEKRKMILELQGVEQLSNELAVIAKQIDRDPNVRFSRVGSKLTLGISNKNKPAFINKFGEVLESMPNIIDKKAVYSLLRETYSNEFTNAELKKAAENISKYAGKVEVIRGKVENVGDLYINSDKFLKSFILQSVEKDVIEKSLIQLLSNVLPPDFKNATVLGNDLSRIVRNRERFISFIRYAREELGWSDKKILRLVYTQYKGMLAGAAKISDGRFIKNQDGDLVLDPKWEDSKEGAFDGNKWKRYTEKDKKDGKIPKGKKVGSVKVNKIGTPQTQDFRGQIFTGTQDLINEVSRIKGFEDIKDKGWNQIAKEEGFDTKTFAETSAAGIKDKNYKGRLKQAKEARESVTELMTYYVNSAKEGIIDYGDVVMLGKMLGSGMTSPMKRAANLAYIGVGVENIPTKQLGSKTEYEHMVPTNVKMLEMVNALINDGKLSDDFWDDYEVAIIPKTMDKSLIRNGLRDFKSPTQKSTDKNWRRYYNKQMLGEPGIVALKSIKPEDKGKIIGEDFVKASEILVSQNINQQTAQIVGRVLQRYSKAPKGASIWDFDDTLARTQSGVRYKLPNPSGTPQPGRKAIFLAGGAGSGKSGVVKSLGLQNQGFKVVNSDISLEWLKKNADLPTDMRDLTPEQASQLGKLNWEARKIAKRKQGKFKGNGDGIVIDGTGGSINVMKKKVQEFKDAGYDVQMIFVETSLDIALERNANRKERSLKDGIVKRNHEAVQGNKEGFKELFGDRFAEVNTDKLSQTSPMPKQLTNKVNDFTSGYINARLEAGEFAHKGADLKAQGAEFDFSEFNIVKEGKQGPLFQKAIARAKKYGTKDQFVLTARPMAAAPHIQEFLKSQGLDIPIENITGLESSTGASKALWVAQKVAEGYNDIYFADDALQNVKAVDDILKEFDVKSKVVQAKVRFSKEGGSKFNEMLERTTGVGKHKEFSGAQAQLRGASVGRFKFFVPPSAEDFKGLLYSFLGKGKQGDADMKFFKEHLLDPFATGIRNINNTKQKMSDEYSTLKKAFPKVVKSLNNKVGDTNFTTDNAIRTYLWNEAGYEVPGLSKQDLNTLLEHVESNEGFKAFAEVLSKISRMPAGYVKPGDYWLTESIASDLHNITTKINRSDFLAEWVENKDIIFSEANLNKIEAVYGTNFREALEDILFRMEKGTNRASGKDKVVNDFQDWINGSVGAVMFFNTRSATLQTLSTVNFLNWDDNNLFKAATAFANQKQYWSDFATLYNSDMLKQRRAGMQLDVNMSELMETVSTAKLADKSKAAIRYLLQVGFTPTQIADSFAISAGGATFYRNKIKKYIKEGMSKKDAETKAFEEFQEIAEETQQSSRPDLISQQQAGTLGRLVLAWANTPMQYTRLTKKAISDLVNKRGDWRSNVSRIIYYGAAQNFIFSSLQTGLAFLLFGGDEEEEAIKTKEIRVVNGMLDTLLRGTGVYGAMASTLKNTILQYKAQREKGYGKQNWDKVVLDMISLSPPIGSKVRKVMNAIKTYEYNKGVHEKMGLRIDNPILSVVGNVVEGITNFPLDRLVRKANNMDEAITGQHELWQRVALALGWNTWSIGIKDEDVEEAKAEVKQERKDKKAEEKKAKKEEKKKAEEDKKKASGLKSVRCSGVKSNGERCGITVDTKAKTAKCMYHKSYKPNEGSDRDNDGIKEYQCKSKTGSGGRCKNRTENTNKKCYAHQ